MKDRRAALSCLLHAEEMEIVKRIKVVKMIMFMVAILYQLFASLSIEKRCREKRVDWGLFYRALNETFEGSRGRERNRHVLSFDNPLYVHC